MTNLSPQAQAIVDAAFPAYDEENLYFLTGEQHTGKIVSAALREVVIQLQYYQCCEDEGVVDMVLDARAVLDIADELEVL